VADAPVSAADYAFLAKWLLERCALVLEPGKDYLLQSRLIPVAARYDLTTVSQLVARLRDHVAGPLAAEVVEAMVTTETSFFRDIHPFETLKKTVLPELIRSRATQKRLNIWCAASSSGQEPYTIAMLLRENFPDLASWTVNLLATDISRSVLDRARQGYYSQLEVNRGMPAGLLIKWFRQEGTHWRIDERLRETVTYSQMNLADPWPAMPTWDLIFLRNVMIYFSPDVKKRILGRVSRQLQSDGYLILGGAETTLNLDDSFQRVEHLKAGFFRLKP
jgi:chemotaxis protein methyltransferase CheR